MKVSILESVPTERNLEFNLLQELDKRRNMSEIREIIAEMCDVEIVQLQKEQAQRIFHLTDNDRVFRITFTNTKGDKFRISYVTESADYFLELSRYENAWGHADSEADYDDILFFRNKDGVDITFSEWYDVLRVIIDIVDKVAKTK